AVSNNLLSSSLPMEYVALTSLQILSLDSNRFSGPLSDSWTQLTVLQELRASRNQLTGVIPISWVGFVAMRILDLSYNALFGSIPDVPSTSMLTHFLLNDNQFTANFPEINAAKIVTISLANNLIGGGFPASYSSLFSLQNLNISYTKMPDSEIPPLTGFASLRVLDMSGNRMSTVFPLLPPSLLYLDISGNNLIGNVPGLPQTLQHLDLSGNMMLNILPSSIATIKRLSFLALDNCSFSDSGVLLLSAITSLNHLSLSGNPITTIPNQLSPLTALTALHACNTKMAGAFPTAPISAFTRLVDLNLCGNRLGPVLPSQLTKLTALTTLNLADNSFKGSLPAAILSMPSLQQLNLNGNGIVGVTSQAIASTANAGKLKSLNLGNNKLTGVPPILSFFAPSLQYLDVSGNSITSPPDIVTSLTVLQHLDLSRNGLLGSFPPAYIALTSLQHLDVSHNNFTGMLPVLTTLTLLTTINLGYNSFFGPVLTTMGSVSNLQEINLQSNLLEGQLSGSLTDFSVLKSLAISGNRIQGSLPLDYSVFTGLEHLDMSNCLFSGALPETWSQLSSIKTLNLSRNDLLGTIPLLWTLITSLTALDLSYNRLDGGLLTFEVEGMANLAHIRLNDNAFPGALPTQFTVLTSLRTLSLSNNLFIDGFPSFLGSFPLLTYANVSHNQLSGPLSEKLSFATSLQLLDLSHNQFDGNLEMLTTYSANSLKYLDISYNKYECDLPGDVTLLKRLEHLDLRGNVILVPLPPTISKLSSLTFLGLSNSTLQDIPLLVSFTDLKHLSLGGSGITSLPNQLSLLTGLTSLNASGIGLTGPFPPYIVNFPGLVYLNLSNNYITGSIPDKLSSLVNLSALSLENNRLQGDIPGKLLTLPVIKTMILRSNALTGITPPGPITAPSLEILDLGYNRLAAIADSLFSLTTLQQLYLNGNVIPGTIPMTFSVLVNLDTLWLNNNQLSGTIPPLLVIMTQLRVLNLGRNLLTGEIASSVLQAADKMITRSATRVSKAAAVAHPSVDDAPPKLESLCLSDNFLAGSIPPSLMNFNRLNDIQLQNNQLSGTIPNVDPLNSLTNLRLADNNFTGTIPESIGGLLLLEHLDLSGNSLSGEIPEDFTGLVKLTVLNLRDNQLTGRLPDPPPNIVQYQLDKNFFTQGFSSPPNCAVVSVRANCVPQTDPSLTCPEDKQRLPEVCSSFCGLTATDPPCNGHGECLLEGPNKVPVCQCYEGFQIGEYRGSCVPVVGGSALVAMQPVAVPAALTATGSASVDGVAKSFTLTPLQAGTTGAVFLSEKVPLFSYQLIADGCGRELAFSSSFSFTLTRTAAAGSEGFAFVIAFDSSPPAEAVAGGMGYAGMAARSVAVEFDTWQDGGGPGGTSRSKNSSGSSGGEPGGNHVGVNVNGSALSVATAAAPMPLNDGTSKYAWIDYDPSAPPDAAAPAATATAAAAGTLRVFLSSTRSPRPSKPVLSTRISLCDVLEPTRLESTFAVGFTAASGSQAQRHAISSWNFTTRFPQAPAKRGAASLGLRVSEATVSPATSGMNMLFRYASSGILPREVGDSRNQYNVRLTSTWLLKDLFWPVKTQTACGDCWAYAVVGSIEAAYSIMANLTVAPQLSALQLRSSMRADCQGGSPSQAFAFLLKAARSGKAPRLARSGGGRSTMVVVPRMARGKSVSVSVKPQKRRLFRRRLSDGGGSSSSKAVVAWRGATASAKQERSPLCMAPFAPLLKLLGISCNGKGATKQQALSGDFYIKGFESTSFYGWFGLLLAVQRQPVVVQIEATAPSFQDYDGVSERACTVACIIFDLGRFSQ
ncbi:unnamed protein product, partial [Closterium sp. NIES-65]